MDRSGPNGSLPPGRPAGAASVERFFELSLLGLVSSGYLAVVGSGYLDTPTAVLTAAGLLLRGLLVTGLLRLRISGRLIAALTLGYIAFYPLDYLFVSGEFLPATVRMVFFLAVIKVLTAQTSRDYVFVAVIAFLELLAASVLSSNLTFFVFLALFLIFGVATFASSEIRRSIRKPRRVARGGLRNLHWRLAGLTLTVAFGVLFLTAGLFFLLPRTAQAAFQHLVPQRYHIPGFSNEMILGEIGQIQKRSTPVMHVRFFSSDAPSGLKWRGNALSQFDGRRWYNPSEAGEILRVREGLLTLMEARRDLSNSRGINYEVQLNSIASDTLFFAGTPAVLRINLPLVIRNSAGGYRLGLASSDGLHYGAYTYLEDKGSAEAARGAPLTQAEGVNHLLLPPVDRRIIALARQVTEGETTEEGRARAIESYLRNNFGYTTDLLPREVPDPLAYFLFERREGHCEYFASAMAVMLRVLYIPSRVATGFQSGVYNPLSGWYLIRASDAHSWVEAWIPGRGWVTFDPTPPDPNPPSASLWLRLGLYVDAAQTFWQEWVLNYNLDRQLSLASQMENSSRQLRVRWLDGFRLAEWKRNFGDGARRFGAPLLAGFLGLMAAAWYWPRAWAWWKTMRRVRQVQRGDARASDATLLYARMLSSLRRRGYQKPAWLTPWEFAALLPPSPTSALVADFTLAYNDLRYGGNPEAAPRMMFLLDELERQKTG